MNTEKYTVIDSWKYIFTVLVVCLHSSWIFPAKHFIRGYLAVEFFFIISGFFLAKSIYSNKYNPYTWLIRKIQIIFPSLFLCIFISCFALFKYKYQYMHIDHFFKQNWTVIYELFCVNNIGLKTKNVLGVTWYISSMIMAGFILYSFSYIFNKRQLIYAVLPIISIYIYIYIDTISSP